MSILKITSGYSSTKMISYCSQEKINRLSGEKIERCSAWKNNLGLAHPEHVALAWEVTREGFGKCAGRQYHHASLSLDPKDPHTQKITDSKMIRMAEKFVQEYAPGHDYSIFIHRDKEHPHAHILWNSVHSETGLKFHASKEDLMRGMEIKDTLDREYGLEITHRQRSKDRIPDQIQRIHQRDPNAYLWTEDLKHRIGEARKEAESFASFQQILTKNGVEADPRGSGGKISYRFTDEQGKQRQCREGKLGEDYARSAVERDFQRNREQHQSRTREHQHAKDSPGNHARIEISAGRDSPGTARGEGIEPDPRAGPTEPDRDHAGVAQANREDFVSRGDIDEAAQRLRELGKDLIGPDRTGTSQSDDSRREVGNHHTEQHNLRGERIAAEHQRDEKAHGVLLDSARGYGFDIRDHRMVDKQMAQYSQARSPGHTGDNPHRETDHAQEKEVAYTILEWKHAFNTYSERGIEPRGRDGIPTNDQRRVDRNDQAYQSELVQAFCVSRAITQRGYEETRRGTRERSGGVFRGIREHVISKIERYSEAIREGIEGVAERFRDFRERAKETLTRLSELRNEVKETQGQQQQHGKEIEHINQDLERVSSTLERETKELDHSDKYYNWQSRDELDLDHSFERDDDGYEMEM
jgi:hypothetical protein